MRLVKLLLACFMLGSQPGCGRTEIPYSDNSQDVDLYAQNMRRTVLMLLERARTGDAPTQMGILATELNHKDRPYGEFSDIYLAMRDLANKAVEICRSNPDQKPNLNVELEELKKLAEKLPLGPQA